MNKSAEIQRPYPLGHGGRFKEIATDDFVNLEQKAIDQPISSILLLVPKDPMSLVMRKPAFCICENKDADQLHGNREADQRLSFRYTVSTIPLLPKSEISIL